MAGSVPTVLAFDLSYNNTGWVMMVAGHITATGVISSYRYQRGERVTNEVRCARSLGVVEEMTELLKSCHGYVFVAYEDPKGFLTAKLRRGDQGRGTNIRTAMSFGSAQERLFYAVASVQHRHCNVVAVEAISPRSWQSYIERLEPAERPSWAEQIWAHYESQNMVTQKRRTKLHMRIALAMIYGESSWDWKTAEQESLFLAGNEYRGRWRFTMTDDEIDAVGVGIRATKKLEENEYEQFGK